MTFTLHLAIYLNSCYPISYWSAAEIDALELWMNCITLHTKFLHDIHCISSCRPSSLSPRQSTLANSLYISYKHVTHDLINVMLSELLKCDVLPSVTNHNNIYMPMSNIGYRRTFNQSVYIINETWNAENFMQIL